MESAPRQLECRVTGFDTWGHVSWCSFSAFFACETEISGRTRLVLLRVLFAGAEED